MTQPSFWSTCTLTSTLALFLCCAEANAAGPPEISPTSEQNRLTEKGAEAYQKGNYEESIKYYKSALVLGELNTIYLVLGRVLQKHGSCEASQEAYRKVSSAPREKGVSPDEMYGRLVRYQKDLLHQCGGKLVLACTSEASLTLDGKSFTCGTTSTLWPGTYTLRSTHQGKEKTEPITITAGQTTHHSVSWKETPPGQLLVSCATRQTALILNKKPIPCGQEIQLPAGQYSLRAVLGEETHQETARVQPGETTQISISLQPPPAPTPLVLPPVPRDISTGEIVGWSLVGSGGALMATGMVFGYLIHENNEEAYLLAKAEKISPSEYDEITTRGDRYQALQFISYGLGIAGTITGSLFLILDNSENASQHTDTRVYLKPQLGLDSWGATLEVNY